MNHGTTSIWQAKPALKRCNRRTGGGLLLLQPHAPEGIRDGPLLSSTKRELS